MQITISLAPEPVFHLGNLAITNSILTGWAVTLLLLAAACALRARLKSVGSRFQTGIEIVYTALLEMTENAIGNKEAARELFPYLVTLFFFVLASNWIGILPGIGPIGVHGSHEGRAALLPLLRAPTSDLNMVFVLALVSMSYVQYLGLKYAGIKGYLKKFFNFENGFGFAMGLQELFGELVRLLSFTFRLFGNIFAGEVLLTVMIYLTATMLPYLPIVPLPFFFLETFVGLLQAFIFCILTVVFVSMAIAAHDSHSKEHGGNETKAPEYAAETEDVAKQRLNPTPS